MKKINPLHISTHIQSLVATGAKLVLAFVLINSLFHNHALAEKAKVASATPKNIYVLSIGIDNYPEPWNLEFSAADAKYFLSQMEDQKSKFRSIHSKLLVNEIATRENILTSLDWVASKVGTNDVGVIYIAGQADFIDSEFGFIPSGESALPRRGEVKNDAQYQAWKNKNAKSIWITSRDIIKLINATSGTLVVIADTNYSSVLLDNYKKSAMLNKTNKLILTATSGKGLAEEDREIGGGVFTRSLLKYLSENNTSIESINEESSQNIIKLVFEQTKHRQRPLILANGNLFSMNGTVSEKEFKDIEKVTIDKLPSLDGTGVEMTARLAIAHPRGTGYMPSVGKECRFIYPTQHDEYVKEMLEEAKIMRGRGYKTTFTWSGNCINGWLHGDGDFGTANFDSTGGPFSRRNVDDDFRRTKFDNGIQRGPLMMRVKNGPDSPPYSKTFVSGSATNFSFDGLFDVTVTTCNRMGILENNSKCRAAAKIFRAVLLDTSANWWNHIFDRTKTALCSATLESVENCRWGSSNETTAKDEISRLVRTGNCEHIESKAAYFRKHGGIIFDIVSLKEECAHAVQRTQQETRFSALLASKNAREMFIAAAGYEDKGERGRAKSLYRAVMMRHSKSNEALMAADRITKLGDVEEIEQAVGRANSDATQRTYQQCKIEMNSCYSRTNGKGNCYRDCDSLR